MFRYAEKFVTSKKEVLNNLNVYPVPDGDTGINMSLTLKEVVKALDKEKNYDISKICEIISESSLMGARGNSGVILSQFIDGFCIEIQKSDSINKEILLKGFKKGTDEAYESVSDPVEGTILTVMRSASDEFERSLENDDIEKILKSVIHKSQETLKRTPDMLPKLKEAGVVDAGGAGFVYFLEGILNGLDGGEEDMITSSDDFVVPKLARVWEDNFGIFGIGGIRSILEFNVKAIKFAAEKLWWVIEGTWNVFKMGINLISIKKAYRLFRYLTDQLKWQNLKRTNTSIINMFQVWFSEPEDKYCNEAILTGVKKDAKTIRSEMKKKATSVIVAKSGKYTKVHFHTKEKINIKKYLNKYGKVEKVKVDDIHEQHKEFINKKVDTQIEEKKTRVLGVVNGEGFEKIYTSFPGVFVVNGGKTMNPSVSSFRRALRKIDCNNVIILPNNKNVFLAARKVKEKEKKNIEVIETYDQAQGLSILLNFNTKGSVSQNSEIMKNSLKLIKTFSVTSASKKSKINGKKIEKGEFIALDKNGLIAKGDGVNKVVLEGIQKVLNKTQLITLYSGKGIPQDESDQLKSEIAQKFKIEVQVHFAGQPHYDYIVALE